MEGGACERDKLRLMLAGVFNVHDAVDLVDASPHFDGQSNPIECRRKNIVLLAVHKLVAIEVSDGSPRLLQAEEGLLLDLWMGDVSRLMH